MSSEIKDKQIAQALTHAHRLGLDPVIAKPLGLGLCIDPRDPLITLHNQFGELIGGWRAEYAVPAAEALKATGIPFTLSPSEGVTSDEAERWWDSIKVIAPVGFDDHPPLFVQLVGRGKRPDKAG